MGCCCSTSSGKKVKLESDPAPIPLPPGSSRERSYGSYIAPPPPVPMRHQAPPPQRNIMVAIYDYEARDLEDVSFIKGEQMELLRELEDGWMQVKHLNTGRTGYIPGNFVANEMAVECEDWFFQNTSRREAERLLLSDKNEPRGTFLVRPSEHNPLGYSLSVKDWSENQGYHIKHYKIMPHRNGGFYIGNNKPFRTLAELISAYEKEAYGLCHILTRPCHKPTPTLWDLSPMYRDKWEIPRDEIRLLKKLGKGNFGVVYYGKWNNQHEVAVKMLKEGASMSTKAFLQEATIMKKFRHKRLVQLYGVCSKQEPVYIIQEYMGKGSLLTFLQEDQGRTLRFDDQVFIAYQIASGMSHLESLNFIHRDLAARNVLLDESNVAKICDFGLARVVEGEIYSAHGGRFPVKWTAPEALTKSIFTIKSDVWSFGILLMELFTFGVTPYEGIQPMLIMDLITSGYRMKKPENLPDEIYELMLRCWHEEPERRPTFQYLEKYFENLDVSYRNQDFNNTIILKHNVPNSYEDHQINMANK